MICDPFEAAIDEIMESAAGDARLALRAVVVEYLRLESELRHLYETLEHGKRSDTKTFLH